MTLRIAVICILLASASGCLSLSATERSTPEPQSLLEKPAFLNETSVPTYVERLEETIIYNDHPSARPTDGSVTCEASIGVHRDTEFALSVQCVGGIQLEGGDHVDVARRTHYYVSPETVKRSSPSNAESLDYDGPQDDPTQGGPGYEVVNFDDERASVTVSFPGATQNSLQFTYVIGPNESVVQNDLPFDFDSAPRMQIDSEKGRTTGHLRPDPHGVRFAHPTVVYVLPAGKVTVARVNATV